jgi:hypothetical protein
MEKKQVTIEEKVTVSGITIVAVVQTSVFSWHNKGTMSFIGLKKPLNVKVTDLEGKTKSFSLQGDPLQGKLFL